MFPKSITADMLAELLKLVRDTKEAVDQVINDARGVPEGTQEPLSRAAHIVFSEYIGDLALLQCVIGGPHQHSLGAWNVSIKAVYDFYRFDRIYEPTSSTALSSRCSFLSHLAESLDYVWRGQRDPGPAGALEDLLGNFWDALRKPRERFDYLVGKRSGERAKIIFITALEHEFQSVVRRLDRIDEITSFEHYGFSLKLGSNEAGSVEQFSFYDASPTKETRRLSPGWAIGSMRGTDVAVICAGGYGADRVSGSYDAFKERKSRDFRSPNCLCIVGVCGATSNQEGRLGDVVISSMSAFLLSNEPSPRKEKNAWSVREELPIEQSAEIVGAGAPDHVHFGVGQALYFRAPPAPPAPSGTGVIVATPPIKLYRRRFLVTPGVIRKAEDRDAAVNAVREWCRMRLADPKCLAEHGPSRFQLDADEWFGIEMECAGLSNRTSLIIKGIVDYADENKGGGWDDSVKLGIQLYAAEVAAETAYRFSHLLSPISP